MLRIGIALFALTLAFPSVFAANHSVAAAAETGGQFVPID